MVVQLKCHGQTNDHGWAVTGRGEWLLQGDWSQFNRIGSVAKVRDRRHACLVLVVDTSSRTRSMPMPLLATDVLDAWLVSSDLSYEADGWNAYGSSSYLGQK